MTREDCKRFAEALDKEAAVIYSGFDGSLTQQDNFRERAATLYYGISSFVALVGMTPARWLEIERQSEGNTLRVGNG
jgi:hypothetical protein